MILPTINPWLLIAAASAILASFIGGMSAGKSLERSEWLEREEQHRALVKAETQRANQVAMIYGKSLQTSQDTAHQLRRKLNEQREQLASCDVRGGVRFTPAFIRLHDDALQADAANSSEPAGAASGADSAAILDTHIENGRRWKDCRNQLNALIDILERTN